ncbi:hypothetical protein [Synechocystis sp. PCC 7509]|uniref:hypothetical protein n=1 Tax=Synechocystis sp. PCC 7509 TaxID=927677 RepID=UPI0002AC2BCB|nr:hypothetical protein [Synechocystis sp. PCC 7509]
MIITSISYQKVKNLGNYESERLEATATVGEDESVTEAVKPLRAFVDGQLTSNEDKVTPLDDEDDIFDYSGGM